MLDYRALCSLFLVFLHLRVRKGSAGGHNCGGFPASMLPDYVSMAMSLFALPVTTSPSQ